jgi:hypothetical protein
MFTITFFLAAAAGALTAEDAQARLQMALQIARERNDSALVSRVEALGKAFAGGLPTDADDQIRQAEQAVGIDPGVWSMAGQPLAHPTPEMKAKSKELQVRLNAAMRTGNPVAVREVTAEMRRVLGDQAGVPDGRRPGRHSPPIQMTPAEAVHVFLGALGAEKKAVETLSSGKLLPGQMARIYAELLMATCRIRPGVEANEPSSLGQLDALSTGVATILLNLQQPEGLFPFPDLRGQNIRFGDMIQRQVDGGAAVVKDGWIITPDADGGSQFDTGQCGIALIEAGDRYKKPEWTRAGLRAADWALAQPCVANFNYNAFSVSLLSRAYQASGDAKYLDGALAKFRVGVAPGQAPNGRWLDSHNARSVYHRIILRGMIDLTEALPESRSAERTEVTAVLAPASGALVKELTTMGATLEALPELISLRRLFPEDAQLRQVTQEMAASIAAKCTDGRRFKMGSAPLQLAALPEAVASE